MLRKSRTRVAFARIFLKLYYDAHPKRRCVWIESVISECAETYPNVSNDIPRAMRRAMTDFMGAGVLVSWYPAGPSHVTIPTDKPEAATVLHEFCGADLDLDTPHTFPSRQKTDEPETDEQTDDRDAGRDAYEALLKRFVGLEKTIATLEEAVLELQNEAYHEPADDECRRCGTQRVPELQNTYAAHPAFFETGGDVR